MTQNIERMKDQFLDGNERVVHNPLPKSKHIINDDAFEKMIEDDNNDGTLEDASGKSLYLQLIGCILWICGYRWDICFVTTYLTWFNHAPRVHHTKVAKSTIKYLYDTISLPLILGGREEKQMMTLSDASEATAPKFRSVISYGTRFSTNSGMISTKVKATERIALSSMEGELTGYFEAFKTSAKLGNLVSEFGWEINPVRLVYGDNEKGVEFLNGDAKGDGIKHADKRLSYLREEVATGSAKLIWVPGDSLVVDGLTKSITNEQFASMRHDLLGHKLLD
jgi:hypothetical protein